MDKSRFSMLILEPGEIYFEDYSCTIHEVADMSKTNDNRGRLKLCSKSLVFEPRNWNHPVLKFHYKDCDSISIVNGIIVHNERKNIIKILVVQYSEMLEDNILAPYKFIYEKKEFYFNFDFAIVEECLSKMQQLQRASTLHAHEHNSMVATILHSLYTRMVFDPIMMEDFSEEIILEMPVEKIVPLVKHQGKLALTQTTLYFQPFNNIEISSILKLQLCHIKKIYKRRFLLRQVGLEIYLSEENSVSHIYLCFQNTEDRDSLYNLLEHSTSVHLERVHIEEMTLQWQNGIVSNYDYLQYLNCLADRSTNDLTQYPVFPWIIADYKSEKLDLEDVATFRDLSKPIGVLNPERLERLRERYHEMSEPKFLYGSHYSAPGLVLFYLVRKYPHYMLCLQNGKFDHPDRMFNSVQDVYNNCLKNMSDFKELVPEFYDTEHKGDFLMNMHNIDFGERHNGVKVQDVALPPWADNCEQFVKKLRDALESDYVSKHLHSWIDLIFGFKQRGDEAIKADNVFYHVCYEGSVDLELVLDMNDRHALEVQIMEFGQVPKQLFLKPHVKRIVHQIYRPICKTDVKAYKIECIDNVKLHREKVTCALLNGERIISVGMDGTLKVYDRKLRKQIRSVVLCSTPLSCCAMFNKNIVAAGSWDNEIYMYDVEYGRIVESFRAHDDSVSCLLWIEKEKLLVSGGWDGVVRVWSETGRAGNWLTGLRVEFDHDEKITALTQRHRRHNSIDLISATSDGCIYVWNVENKVRLSKINSHESPITALCYLSAGDRVVTSSEAGELCITDLTVSHSVFSRYLEEGASSLCWDGEITLWLGGQKGSLFQWSILNVSQLQKEKINDDAINSIFLDKSTGIIVTASADKSVNLLQILKSS